MTDDPFVHQQKMHSGNLSLDDMNDMKARELVPAVIVLAIMAVTGVVGNLLVISVFSCRYKRNNYRLFVLFLAGLDITVCCLIIPFEVVTLRYPLTYSDKWLCKIMRFIGHVISISSGIVLVIIAIERYLKVCKPLGWQMSHSVAKILCACAVTISVVLSWPSIILFGDRSEETSIKGMYGVSCSIDDQFKDTIYPPVFNITKILASGSSFAALIILYSFIGKRIFSSHPKPSVPTSQEIAEYSVSSETETVSNHVSVCDKKRSMKNKQTTTHRYTIHVDSHEKRRMKNTLMLFIITIVFMGSYVPHLVLTGLREASDETVENLHKVADTAYHLLLRSFFINHIANPIIYGFCDASFREKCKKMIKGFF